MSKRRTNEELKKTIESGEGLGWALEEYDASELEDPDLADLWMEAQGAMDEVREYLEVDN